ncbi:hypothetical protein I5M32_11460 [Pedobacter sp. SD-b]|uniref:Uncharacterized protein n=1 Tax=Pedobacter segetis TaxID=2793069 RepID=A0ABS1BL09_9SPHI|nr:hypothetical protein [Pedobacter segetis]MBK0383575.1 hypothetical protein [Pedobacter segetis]
MKANVAQVLLCRWANRLWVISYGPHKPFGSSDKLYEIANDLKQIVREESVGGTSANRMIHRESMQLNIGPYFIDTNRNVRVLNPKEVPGRFTGTARHLTNPSEKLYIATMEEGFYEVDVNSLKTNTLYEDGNILKERNKTKDFSELLPGAHGKGLYSGQGVMVYSNNGDADAKAYSQFDIPSGVLAEWNGKDWKVIRRNQFVEVTGPGGIYGNKHPEIDPIWATGWDNKSILLGVRDYKKGWSFFRLPKASHSYDGAHGWNTEWPRIRDVGTSKKPDYLMTMHGMFWTFPGNFSSNLSAGIRPQSAYLKVIGDFTRWQNQLVFGCDDAAKNEFLNKRKIKGITTGPGQSNSNLWFTSLDQTQKLGPNTAEGAIWLKENVEANKPSEPFLFAGWENRNTWVLNEGNESVTLKIEVDINGDNNWELLQTLKAEPGKAINILFEAKQKGEWIRAISDKASILTFHLSYTDLSRFNNKISSIFNGIETVANSNYKAGLLYSLGDNRRILGVLSGEITKDVFKENGYYELNEQMQLVRKDDTKTADFIRDKFTFPKNNFSVEESSILIVDDKNRRWRLPLGESTFTDLTKNGLSRVCREVSTERDLMNLQGTFYELPAENADGFAKIRPITSHNLAIYDYASYRGMLVLTGIKNISKNAEHIITSNDGKAKVWVGAIDDLWQLGKPMGHGGPWKDSQVTKNIPSDPYLIGFYDKRSVSISHHSDKVVKFKIEVEPIGHGPWMLYKEVEVQPGKTFNYTFPDGFQARWIRFVSCDDCKATAWLNYE